MRKDSTPTAIRLSVTNEVRSALLIAKRRYPTLSDSEILKLGLSKIITEDAVYKLERSNIRAAATHAVGRDYLADQDEELYGATTGKRVHFS